MSETEKLLRSVGFLNPGKMLMVGAEPATVYMNQAWETYVGASIDDIKQPGWQHHIHPEDIALVNRYHNCMHQGSDPVEFKCRVRDRYGKYNWHLVKGAQVAAANTAENFRVYFYHEIPSVKNEDQRRSEFIRMLCHELKTPVSVIKGFAQILAGLVEQEEQSVLDRGFLKSCLQPINRQSDMLSSLIDELLEMSRVEEQEFNLFPEKFVLNDLLTETVGDMKILLDSHEIELEASDSIILQADKKRLQQVLINLINNAVKYSPGKNKVDIKLEVMPCLNNVCITVRDYGIGISAGDQAKVFERFFRVAGGNQTRFNGFGIGLYISDSIVKAHGGRIKINSELGKGSEFVVFLPLHVEKRDFLN